MDKRQILVDEPPKSPRSTDPPRAATGAQPQMQGLEDAEIAKILSSIKGVDLAQRPVFPPEVNKRISLALAKAERRLGSALKAKTAAQRVMWLNRAVDAKANDFGPQCDPYGQRGDVRLGPIRRHP